VDYEDQGEWLDDTVWSQYFNVTNENISNLLWDRINGNRTFFEAVPIRWTRFDTAHGACSWFGRLGAGDIMARYRSGQNDHALSLLSKFSSIVVQHHNIYEGYDMNGCGLQSCGCTTSGFGDYLEHCGGLIWSVVDGLFGWNFDSKSNEYAATIEPRFPSSWTKRSEMKTSLRGLEVDVRYESGVLSLSGGDAVNGDDDDDVVDGVAVRVRIVGCDGDDNGDIVVLSRGVEISRRCD